MGYLLNRANHDISPVSPIFLPYEPDRSSS